MKRKGLIWLVVAVVALVVLVLLPGGAKQQVEVAAEFELHPVIRLPHIGPVDLSATKAVICLWITTIVIIVVSLVISRSIKRTPNRRQGFVELMYGLAHDGIVGSVMTSQRAVWFPYIGAVFFFILLANVVGLIPLPFGDHHQLAFYAATGNLNVTIALALITFVFTHYAGIRAKGVGGYFKSMVIPSAPPVLRQMIFVLHLISEVFKLISLSVRLFANMLAGHAILAVFFAMALTFQSYLIAVVLQGGSVMLYLFELFVAFIQAFIFAILSAVYISAALEEGH